MLSLLATAAIIRAGRKASPRSWNGFADAVAAWPYVTINPHRVEKQSVSPHPSYEALTLFALADAPTSRAADKTPQYPTQFHLTDMHEFENAFASAMVNKRWLIIVLALVFVVIASGGTSNLYFTSSYRVFFGPDNPQLLAFEQLEKTYSKNDNVLIVVEPPDGDVFNRETLAAIIDITERSWQMPFSSRVDSITNFQHSYAEEDDLLVGDLVRRAATLDSAALAKTKAIALAEPALRARLIADDASVTAVNVTLQMPSEDNPEDVPTVAGFARTLVDDLRGTYPDHKFYLTGSVMMDNGFGEQTLNDMQTLVPLSFAVMLILLAVLVGGAIGTFATLFVIAFSIIAAMGIAGYLGFPVTPPLTSAPIIILTVAVANCVHVLVTHHDGLRHGLKKHAAITESLRVNLHPVTLASVTTAIGFSTLNFSEVPPFAQLGTVVAIGIVISLALSVSLLPALIAVAPQRAPRQQGRDDKALARLSEFVIKHQRRLLWGMSVLIVLVVVNIARNDLNDIYVHWFDPKIQFRIDTDFAVDRLTGVYNIEYSLESGASGGISEPEFLRQVDAFAEWFRRVPGVMHVATFTDVMRRLNMNMHGDDRAMYKLPDNRELAAQYLLLYEMSLPYGLDLNNQINVDKSSLRVIVTTETLSTNDMLAMNAAAEQWLADNAPAIEPSVGSGATMMFSNIGRRNIRAMLLGTACALVLISFLMVFALRSAKIGLISLIPNLAPAAMGFGLWGLFVGEVGLALSVVVSMTLGIVIDDSVHFLSKYLRARREQGLNSEDAVRYAFTTVGRALVVTSIILVVGFLILATSLFELNSGMGLLTALIIGLALFTDFLYLPPLLMRVDSAAHQPVTVPD